jgi:hypothetical protein
MSPQLHSILAKVLDLHYAGKSDPEYVIGALVRIAGEPTFSLKLGIESIRAARQMLSEALVGNGNFLEAIRDRRNRAVIQEWSLAQSACIRRSSGRDPIPLLGEGDDMTG